MLPTDGHLDETIAGEQWRWTDRALFTRQMDMYTHPHHTTPTQNSSPHTAEVLFFNPEDTVKLI